MLKKKSSSTKASIVIASTKDKWLSFFYKDFKTMNKIFYETKDQLKYAIVEFELSLEGKSKIIDISKTSILKGVNN